MQITYLHDNFNTFDKIWKKPVFYPDSPEVQVVGEISYWNGILLIMRVTKKQKLEQIGVGRKKLIVSSAKSAEFNGEINSLFSQTDTSFPQAVLPLLPDCDHFKGWQRRHEYV